jgi:MOSC domain-containing protein YiiM
VTSIPMPDHPTIFQINTSSGGVPKLARQSDEVAELGLAHDRQASTTGHGGPERAVCLYALERILALHAEGHPIFPGAIGENVTVVGLDWDRITPGTRLRLGESVVLEVTRYGGPCTKIAGSFIGGEFARVLQDQHPGWSRAMARVLAPGTLRVGDAVVVEGA